MIFKQFPKYGGVAAGSALADYAVFSALLFMHAGVLPAQMTARIMGGLFSFFANKYWSFDAHGTDHVTTEGRRFLVLYAASYTLALAIVYVLTETAGVSAYPAKITADVTCFAVNFLVMRSYVFGGGRGLRDRFRSLLGVGGKAPEA